LNIEVVGIEVAGAAVGVDGILGLMKLVIATAEGVLDAGGAVAYGD